MCRLDCRRVDRHHTIASVIGGAALLLAGEIHAGAATIVVPAGGDLQSALNAAQAGDVIALEPGATYVGNFVLPDKGEIDQYIVVRSAAADSDLPPANIRITPAYAARLPKIRSANEWSAMSTAPSANHWKLLFLEFLANQSGAGEIIALGAGDSRQSDLSQVPHDLVLDRLYIHGDHVLGQKRGVSLNSRDTAIINSYISECKAVSQDSQAIQGHNGPGNFLIENNYLEGAAENFMLGGADPAIPNLVTTNVLFRRNYLSKPLAWRDGIVSPPADVSATATDSGALAAGTYAYRVVARTVVGQGKAAVSPASAEVLVTIDAGATGGVALAWTGVPGAVDYLVYGRTAGAANVYWTTTEPAFTDSGAAGTSGTPGKATKWSVKNLFELKNARDVVVEGNVMENLWVADQSGYALQLTPRNQNGRAPWSTVERVTVRGNLLRHVAGGVNVLGRDNLAPSEQANHLSIEHNLFDDVTAETWGSGSRPFQLGAGPDAVTIDHNTIITTDSAILYLYGGSSASPTRISNSAYTNNMSRHNAYGITGSNYSPGLSAILAYMPDGVVTANVLAGGTASRYPGGNYFPSVADWQAGFADYASGDYHLAAGSPYTSAATDGGGLGADIDMVAAHATHALAGDVTDSPSRLPISSGAPLAITTTSLADGRIGDAYAATLAASGGSGTRRWAVASGALASGITLDESGTLTGVPTAAGRFDFTVQVSDSQAPPNIASRLLSITVAPAAVSILTASLPDGAIGVEYRSSLVASGGSGTYAWSLVDGALPPGLLLDPAGTVSGTPAVAGTFALTVQASDAAFPQNAARGTFSIAVSAPAFTITVPPPPAGIVGQPYQIAASAHGQIGTVSWSIVAGALPPGVQLNRGNGVISGTPTAAGTFSASLQAEDVGAITRTATQPVTIVVYSSLAIVTTSLPEGNVGSPYAAALAASGSAGGVVWTLAAGALPDGLTLAASGAISGSPTRLGSSTFTVAAADSAAPANTAARDFTVVVKAREIVLYTSAARVTGNAWSRTADTGAADGTRIWNPDRGRKVVKTASAAPASYVELTFEAEAGTAYHLWLRAKAERDSTANDSVHVQFSESVDASGEAIYRIGTTQSAVVTLQDTKGAGVEGWGWQDNRSGGLARPLYFHNPGAQTIRLQQREDGFSVDQIVLSAATYLSTSPGALKNDTVIVPK